MMNKEIKEKVRETELMLTETNNMLNKAIAYYKDSMYTEDRNSLRAIRDQNIKTIQLIQKMELVGLI